MTTRAIPLGSPHVGSIGNRPRVVVAIPAKDEERWIGAALSALRCDAGASGVRCEVVVLANDCRDATAAVARASGARVVERRLPPDRANAGHARRLAMEAALALCGPGDVLATSDADARLVPGSLRAIVAAMRSGADLVCGGISTTLPVEIARAPSIRRIDGATEPYQALVHEVRFAIDRLCGAQPDGPRPHYVESGACMALTPALCRAVGGSPDVATSEDRALVRAAERAGARVAYVGGAHAWVSARLDGRARGGMSEAIRNRLVDPDPTADQALASAAALRESWEAALGGRRPPPVVADPPLRASDLERGLAELAAFVRDVVRPELARRLSPAAVGRRVA